MQLRTRLWTKRSPSSRMEAGTSPRQMGEVPATTKVRRVCVTFTLRALPCLSQVSFESFGMRTWPHGAHGLAEVWSSTERNAQRVSVVQNPAILGRTRACSSIGRAGDF